MEDFIRHDRGHLPHIEFKGASYFVTFRLADSLPAILLNEWKNEIQTKEAPTVPIRTNIDPITYFKRAEEYLDSGKGECWLKDERVANLVVQSLKHFDGVRYVLHAWCVMPNHVHVIFQPTSAQETDSDLIPILHSWKSYTAHQANKFLGKTGKFWQEEYFDRILRNANEFRRCVIYTIENPVKAGLCKTWKDWPWSGCSKDIMKDLNENNF